MAARLLGLTVPVAVLATACSTAPVTEDAARPSGVGVISTRDGVFTAAQAERGRGVYDDQCASCHPPAFYVTQLAIWQGTTVRELFDSLSATMPAENPGALATSQYLDVIAYILSITGSPSGERELTMDNSGAVRIVGGRADGDLAPPVK